MYTHKSGFLHGIARSLQKTGGILSIFAKNALFLSNDPRIIPCAERQGSIFRGVYPDRPEGGFFASLRMTAKDSG